MHQTPASLLEKLRKPGQDEAWKRFVELYAPLLFGWARRQGASDTESADLVQEVLLILVRKLPDFEREGPGSFRGWLRTITINKWRETLRRKSPELGFDLDQFAEPDDESFEAFEYGRYLVQRALEMLRPHLPPSVWVLFREYVLEAGDPQNIADAHQVTLGTVYAAKSKVMRRLREELKGLLDT